MMRHPAEAIRVISGNRQSASTSIIVVWAKATPVARQNLLPQQHLVGLGTTSDAAGKMQPDKVSTNLVFHNFNKLACPYTDFLKSMKGKQIKKIPTDNAVIPLPGDNLLHVVSLPLAILVSYEH
eukprot:648001-Ditylum_brightwellii.AAC.1